MSIQCAYEINYLYLKIGNFLLKKVDINLYVVNCMKDENPEEVIPC